MPPTSDTLRFSKTLVRGIIEVAGCFSGSGPHPINLSEPMHPIFIPPSWKGWKRCNMIMDGSSVFSRSRAAPASLPSILSSPIGMPSVTLAGGSGFCRGPASVALSTGVEEFWRLAGFFLVFFWVVGFVVFYYFFLRLAPVGRGTNR